MSTATSKISCPRCKKPNTWTKENTFRPFCSERCKLIDLGNWAAEKHRVAGDPANPDQTTADPDNNKRD